MKVNPNTTNPAAPNETRESRGKKTERAAQHESAVRTSASKRPPEPNASVNAEISPKAKEFARAKELAGVTPDVREDKVADLKKRISEGSYKVDAEAVADRMVQEHLMNAME